MGAVVASGWSIPLTGPLAEGECVRIGWPEEADFDAITELRNRDEVRRLFLDSRPLDPVRNRQWLREGMKRPYEAVLAIRMKRDNAFVGAIGWSRGDPREGSLELGRVMVDTRALGAYKASFPAGYQGVAVDAGMAVRDFAFPAFGLSVIRMVVIESNRLSLRAAIGGGGRVVGVRTEVSADDALVRLVDLECRRADWEHIRERGPLVVRNLLNAFRAVAEQS